ncbi:MAG TPA: hemolysin family protein [Gemmatimonadaceae bacterium]|nr:hemolysin family protein [Gemmatimonadaceae bacterium]
MSTVALIVALIALLAAALIAAADGALLSVSDLPNGGAIAEAPTGGSRDATHRALSIARLIALVVAGVLSARAFELAAQSTGVALAAGLGIAAVAVVLGDIIPRAAGEAVGARTLAALGTVVRAVDVTMRPLVAAGAVLDAALRRLLPPYAPGHSDREITAEQFRRIVTPQDAVPHRAIMHRVFSFSDTEVHEVMVPRVDIFGLERGTPWSEVLDRVRSSQHARLPVYDETIDHITGILFAKDLLPAVIADQEPAAGWESIARPASFIPESKAIEAQLRDFKATRSHIAIVVDEFGGTAGLVTIENVLEEIVGDIRDEYDREEPPIEAEDGRRWWVSGRVTLDELSDALGHRFDRPDVNTVGGLIFEAVGHVPKAGQELELDGFRIVVERVNRRRVDRVYFERPESPVEHVS